MSETDEQRPQRIEPQSVEEITAIIKQRAASRAIRRRAYGWHEDFTAIEKAVDGMLVALQAERMYARSESSRGCVQRGRMAKCDELHDAYEKNEGFLEVGYNETGEVVVNHPDLKPDENGVRHIVFSPKQARNLADLLCKHATLAEFESRKRKRGSARKMTGGPVTRR